MWFEATFMAVSSKQSGRFVSTLRERLVRGEIREPQWIPGSFMKLALQAFTELKMIFKKVQEGCTIRGGSFQPVKHLSGKQWPANPLLTDVF
jgi:hypothetical protein